MWNRPRYVKDPVTGKRISGPNDANRVLVQDVPDLRVVPQELWDEVKSRRATLKRNIRPDLREGRSGITASPALGHWSLEWQNAAPAGRVM